MGRDLDCTADSSLWDCEACVGGSGIIHSNWPAPPTIHRGVEWSQFFNCSLFDCLIVGKFSNSSPHPPLLARSPDDPQRSRVVSVFELFSVCLFVLCLIVGKFSNYSPHPPLNKILFYKIKTSLCKEFVLCLFVLCLSANFLIFYSTVQYSIVQYSTVQYSTVRNLFFKCSGHKVQYGIL